MSLCFLRAHSQSRTDIFALEGRGNDCYTICAKSVYLYCETLDVRYTETPKFGAPFTSYSRLNARSSRIGAPEINANPKAGRKL